MSRKLRPKGSKTPCSDCMNKGTRKKKNVCIISYYNEGGFGWPSSVDGDYYEIVFRLNIKEKTNRKCSDFNGRL